MFHKVNSVSPIKDYQVSAHFWDGTTKIYDVKPLFDKWPVFKQLKENDLFDELPKDIQKTAELRLENQESTLSELASLHEPPISKSGLNHRLSKIIDEAKKRKLI